VACLLNLKPRRGGTLVGDFRSCALDPCSPHSPLKTSPGLAVGRFARPLTSEQPWKDVVGFCGLECSIEVSFRGPAIVKYFILGLYGYLKLLHFILEYCKTKFK
jgi:hypothetical protein